jgi:nucleoside-diphosphate-sugar epimerase
MSPESPQASGESKPELRFLITGAKGFIGAWIVKNLVERGNRPYVFDLDTDSDRLRALLSEEEFSRPHFIQGDITRLSDLERAVGENGITHLIHLAALQVPACAADPAHGGLINVVGTLNLFEVARRHREQVKNVVYASSAAVFGPEEFYGHTTVREGATLLPGTHYGVFKQCNEGNARVYYANEGICSVGLRPWAVYGVGRDQGITSGPTKAIKAAVISRPYTIRFTGGLDLQYVNDTAQTFLRCVESDLDGAKIYNLRGSVTQTSEFIDALTRIVPQARDLVRAEGGALPIAYDLDDSALVRDLGDVPRTPLDQGIRETVAIFERLQRAGRLSTSDLEA